MIEHSAIVEVHSQSEEKQAGAIGGNNISEGFRLFMKRENSFADNLVQIIQLLIGQNLGDWWESRSRGDVVVQKSP